MGAVGAVGAVGWQEGTEEAKVQNQQTVSQRWMLSMLSEARCFHELLISPSRHSNISSFQRWLNFSGPDVVAWIKLQVLKTTTPLLPQGNVNKLFTSPASGLREPNLLQCFSSKLVNQKF